MTDARDIVERLVRIETRENSHGLANDYVVNPDGLEASRYIATLRKQLDDARSEALDEAAKVAESHSRMMHILDHTDSAKMIGSKIRALKGKS